MPWNFSPHQNDQCQKLQNQPSSDVLTSAYEAELQLQDLQIIASMKTPRSVKSKTKVFTYACLHAYVKPGAHTHFTILNRISL